MSDDVTLALIVVLFSVDLLLGWCLLLTIGEVRKIEKRFYDVTTGPRGVPGPPGPAGRDGRVIDRRDVPPDFPPAA